MEHMTYQEAFQSLRQAGFVREEIDRLYRLRRTYRVSELDAPPLDLHRLRFVRWLIATGRLTDQFPRDAGKQRHSTLHELRSRPSRQFPFLFF